MIRISVFKANMLNYYSKNPNGPKNWLNFIIDPNMFLWKLISAQIFFFINFQKEKRKT